MSEDNPSNATSLPGEVTEAANYKQREAWFTATPNPWEQLAALEFGADRTYASTVQRMVLSAEPDQHSTMEAHLIRAIGGAEITDAGRQIVCRMLGWIGSGACVPAVAPLLDDDRTADDARRALDGIADPAVDEVYRAALGRLTGRAKIGLIGSMVRRRDIQSVDTLTALALDPGEAREVRAAAERAVEQLSAEVSS